MNRCAFLGGLLAAPAIVRVSSIMPVSVLRTSEQEVIDMMIRMWTISIPAHATRLFIHGHTIIRMDEETALMLTARIR